MVLDSTIVELKPARVTATRFLSGAHFLTRCHHKSCRITEGDDFAEDDADALYAEVDTDDHFSRSESMKSNASRTSVSSNTLPKGFTFTGGFGFGNEYDDDHADDDDIGVVTLELGGGEGGGEGEGEVGGDAGGDETSDYAAFLDVGSPEAQAHVHAHAHTLGNSLSTAPQHLYTEVGGNEVIACKYGCGHTNKAKDRTELLQHETSCDSFYSAVDCVVASVGDKPAQFSSIKKNPTKSCDSFYSVRCSSLSSSQAFLATKEVHV
jgi:hypothetical protein